MKIEKISEDKIKIILSLEELSEKNITLNDLEKNSSKTRNFFISLIDEINLNDSFLHDNPQIFIEARTDNDNSFIITITKIDYLPDISDYNLLKDTKIKSNIKISNYKIKNNIIGFNTLNEVIFLSKLLKESFYLGKNSLYSFNNVYYLVFSKYTVKNINFQKTYNYLSEYSLTMKDSDFFSTILVEKGKLIIKDKALQKLSKI